MTLIVITQSFFRQQLLNEWR